MTAETQKFDAMSHDDWWSPRGRLFALHRINPLRFEYFKSRAGDLTGRRVLDVGCGGGILAEKFAEAGSLVTGIDLSPVAIEAARRHAEAGGLNIDYRVQSTSALLAQNPEPFDIITCAEVLEHVDDIRGFIRHSIEMLRPGGLYFFGTINKTLKARFFAIFVAEDLLRMVPPGTHDFKRFVRPSVLAGVLRENNVEVREIKGLSYDPLRLEFRISNDPSVNYLGYGVKQA